MLETEPIRSIPRPASLMAAHAALAAGTITAGAADELAQEALVDTIARFEASGSLVTTDGEQTKSSGRHADAFSLRARPLATRPLLQAVIAVSALSLLGVIDPIDPRVETEEEVRDRVLEAAEILPVDQLGTCDDCGFSPFGDDTSTSRDLAFEEIRVRVAGTALASEQLGA